ncbi:hypothetical protein EMIHUDRAFT_193707 [Emiliania huxleyi CCMP1516]|uniref:DNA helicase n=2 Tax=Emiliania huxleyi TaxID=2903 RepID=A0A0D3L0B2_EMIH1|nr:hypothetical protein EMIHUDRAFT_193707 [Emiliania huxleyi CCMP1516]EOD41447.1 hypothetical protein EMIHUDRAFT_193707 [Emiliania huxleyi CCMP1516]|eukprot:XP_005793876.1 hypothetical protein EMIHUDRAFT_193707 [Emiliania huxleyi CCMP1516]
MWNRAMHKDRKIMAGKDPRDLSAFEPSVVKQKTRLVVSFYFRNFEHGEALTKLYREFVAKVMDLARQKAIGCPQEESFHNTETLSALVEEYNLAPVLASSWTGKLNQTEKLQLERKIGDESRRIDFGLKVAASCLDLSIQIGTQLTVDGCTHLYNEVTRELVPFPIVDQHDLVYLVVYLDLDLGMWTHVMVDEMQDVTRILYLFILQLVRRRANLLMATLEQMLHGREQYTHMLNYRSARSVIEATQPALAATGSTDTIVQIRDVDGEYRENVTFHSHPIVAGERTALLTRMAATVFEIYNVLLSKGYIHVKMVGRKSTRDNVLKLLGELEGPMSSVLTRLNLRLDSSAPASQNERHDTTLALQASITAWSKLASAGDIDALDSRTAYSAWLEKVYTEDAAAGDTLVVSTIHGYKGRQATRVCIFQPDHLPLPDRLRLKDDPWRSWEADEERCIFNVALSRAEDRLHLMVHLEDGANRTGLLTLWDAPADLETSQSTEATASIISSQESAGEPDEVDEATNGALAVLQLEAVPANLQELAAAVRQNLRAANSSIANFDSPAVQARTQECLGARRHLTKVITRRNLQRVDDAMALHH